jgi:hypothetical protein
MSETREMNFTFIATKENFVLLSKRLCLLEVAVLTIQK